MLTLSDFGRIDVKIGNAQALQFPGTKDKQIQGKDGGKTLNSMKSPVLYIIIIIIKYEIKPMVLWGTTLMISHQGYIFWC